MRMAPSPSSPSPAKSASTKSTSKAAATTAESTTTTAPMELRKQLRQIHLAHTTHSPATKPRGIGGTIFVLAHVVALASLWIGQNGIGFHYQFELLLITALKYMRLWC